MREEIRGDSEAGRRQWAIILLEVAACYAFIYYAVYYNLPKHEYIFFVSMIPLYRAGTTFGYAGSVICGIIVTLLFLPLIPVAPFIYEDPDGLAYAIGMIVFINTFGIFIGGAIGRSRIALRDVDAIFSASDAVASETGEHALMLRFLKEALVLSNARYSAVLVRKETGGGFLMFATSLDSGAIEQIDNFDERHPLVLAARENTFFATNSALTSGRFSITADDTSFRSFLAVPVATGDSTYGAILVAGKANDEIFTQKDLTELQMLADTAAVSIQSIEQETHRQREAMREEKMRELFSRYVSASVAEFVLKNPDLLKNREQRVSVLVSDIRNFTSISESTPAEELVASLNEYFTRMVDVILEHGGTIDKFIGDCIIAYWGAPAPDPDHAAHAAGAALAMKNALDELNENWRAQGKSGFGAGIGLHTCDVLLGNVGDDRKKAFTILGEEVDNAMRIESLTKELGATIVVSQPAADGIATAGFNLEKLEGSKDSVALYSLKGAAG